MVLPSSTSKSRLRPLRATRGCVSNVAISHQPAYMLVKALTAVPACFPHLPRNARLTRFMCGRVSHGTSSWGAGVAIWQRALLTCTRIRVPAIMRVRGLL